MPRPKTVKPKPENVQWSEAFRDWMKKDAQQAEDIAEYLHVSVRTVDRWRSGESVPDASRRARLAEMGAPALTRAKKGPAASKRLETLLLDIVARLERIEKRLQSL